MRFYLLCGLPFSGKSTFAQLLKQKTGAMFISLDELITNAGFNLTEQLPVEVWEQAHQQALALIKKYSEEGKDLILDDTNFLIKLRDRLRDVAIDGGYDVQLVYIQAPLKVLEQRRANTRGKRNTLNDEAFYPVVNGFEEPTQEEKPHIIDGTRDFDKQLDNFVGAK
jgi:predicted kinase